MTSSYKQYPIGVAGKPWGDDEKQQWFTRQVVKRSYALEVESKLKQLHHEVIQYGELSYSQLSTTYPLYCIKIGNQDKRLPNVLVTGGVHGYETSGVQGAIEFAKSAASKYQDNANIFILPCISPWAYETINRWNPDAIDPNRSFKLTGPSQEANQAMAFVASLGVEFLMHIDLHETTDTDNSEFRPALSARDAIEQKVWDIPDGFYTVGDTARPQAEFQRAIIQAVEKVTHIAEADPDGKIIGARCEQRGVINYDKKSLYLCGGFTNAEYVSTTEVYPDSPNASDAICTQAQVAAISGALDYLEAKGLI
ncbi:M14 family metallocarboxypeptidase [Glaciecola sp. MH2013]|uniref:M14 family metallopeptidase n=1 Tax=Glaciecola sp. MH2013 TaxID=2785524 RepID=UPI0018A07014|nr:M14 family metallocarboxypeptidase [Glaciecola sp. MH2013]MBF7072289.1 M14 family metallocarboxypeptidase [Glaciecola sp. MH2013]